MRKNGIGLTSVPIGNTPGDENVEISHVTDDDIEASNRTGFNQIGLQDFLDDKEFSEIINIEKESFKMRKELIKLNNQLNRLGYKNLIKVAQNTKMPALTDDNLKKELGDLFYLFMQDLREKVFPLPTKEYSDTYLKPSFVEKRIDNNKFFDILNKHLDTPFITDDKLREMVFEISTFQNRQNLINYYNTHMSSPKTVGATGKETPAAAAAYGLGTKSDTPTEVSHQAGTELRDDDYRYKINGPLKVTITLDNGRTVTWTPQSAGISKWNIFADNLNKMTLSTSAPATPSAGPSPTPPPVAADTTTDTPTTSGTARETINGKPAVSVGTFRGNVLYVTMESIKAGKPVIYVKSPEGRVQILGEAEDNRARDYLGNREIRRILRALEGYGLDLQGRESFKDYMRSDRRNRWNRVRGKKYEDETDKRVDKASQRMQGSNAADDGIQSTARQKRLDSLKKKGII